MRDTVFSFIGDGVRAAPARGSPRAAGRRPLPQPGELGDHREDEVGERARAASRTSRQPGGVGPDDQPLTHRRAVRPSRWPLGAPARGPGEGLRRTVSIRWTTVTRLATREQGEHDEQDDLGQAEPASSTARPARSRARTATSRSARSAIPTFAVIPSPSARARAYETTLPRTRQARASAAMHACRAPRSRGVVQHQATEDGGVADPVEGGVEERAPGAGPARAMRAMIPSMVSENTNAVITSVPRGTRRAGRRPAPRRRRPACRRG